MNTTKEKLINIIRTLTDKEAADLLKHITDQQSNYEVITSEEDKKAIKEGMQEIAEGKIKSWEEVKKEE